MQRVYLGLDLTFSGSRVENQVFDLSIEMYVYNLFFLNVLNIVIKYKIFFMLIRQEGFLVRNFNIYEDIKMKVLVYMWYYMYFYFEKDRGVIWN